MIVRHRATGRTAQGAWALSIVVVLLLGLGGWISYRLTGSSDCSGTVRLSVATAPEIAPAIRDAATRWAGDDRRIQGKCVAVDVVSANPADIAVAIASRNGATLDGLGQPDGRTQVPEIWIPDSSTWLQRLRAIKADLVPTDAPSVARSPVVLAMPEPVAAALGWTGGRVAWPALLDRLVTDSRLHAGIVEPTRDAASVSALLALSGVAATLGPDGQQAVVGAIRALAEGRSEVPSALLVRFPGHGDTETLAAGLALAPLSEQAVLAYNANKPLVPLTGLALDPAPAALDYPYTVLPGLSPARIEAAEALRLALSDLPYRDQLSRQRLRTADGTPGTEFLASVGNSATVATATPAADPSAIGQVLATWIEVTRAARMLAVIDVSGSMLTPVPAAGGLTREQVAVAAAKGGLQLFDNSWEVGLWIFATNLDGDKDYRQLVPLGPLTSQRTTLRTALDGIQPVRKGNTGLYDTILAAYRTVQDGWDPGRGNSVVMITDGKNDDPRGLTRDQLLAELKRIADPKRPVQVILLGIGTEVTEGDLSPIPQVTGGGAFIAKDPSTIGDIFLKALTLPGG
ncbi:MAG: hypothetical protein AUI14_01275 [Actinobacteria bacterium 13_2_20CM_2_71_6]|nr:MAG: hypothetical protein AUI14_01275 [Actinobacteria bacterium 13_2_20CM_2_71_6]